MTGANLSNDHHLPCMQIANVVSRNPGLASSLADAIDHSLASVPPEKALVVVGQFALTYGCVVERMSRLYILFAEINLKPGDRAVIVSKDDAAVVVLFLALLRAGITAVIGDRDMPTEELWRLIDAADPRAVFLDTPLAEAASHEPRSRVTTFVTLLTDDARYVAARDGDVEAVPLRKLLEGLEPGTPPAQIPDDRVGLIVFTSGTTSHPKGVQLTHGNLRAQLATFSDIYGFGADSRIFNLLPLHHVDGLIRGPLAAFFAGGTVHRVARFRAQSLPSILDEVRATGATHFVAVPSLLSLILRLALDQRDCFRGPEFLYVISSADTLDITLWRDFESQFRVRVVNAYGLSETVCDAMFCGPTDNTYRIGTIGKPAGCEARLVDDYHDDVEPGQIGELLIRGPIVMKGYFREPEATAAVLIDGWFHTGDLARTVDHGFFEFVGRKKNIIKSRGVSISPEEVTATIRTIAGVMDAVTIGVANESRGELIVACVVVNEKSSINEATVLEHCRRTLPPEKLPSHVFLVDELPRGPAGKSVLPEVERIAKARLSTEQSGDEKRSVAEVYSIAAACLKVAVESLSPESTPFNTQGWDSMAHLDFILSVEKSFGIRFSPSDILNFESLADAEEIVQNHMNLRH